MRWLLLLAGLGGCDQLFNVDRVPYGDGDGGAGDGALRGDGMAMHLDGGPCVPNGFDEDGDGISDNCDGCPTVMGSNIDDDLDGVPTICDPELGAGKRDQVLLSVMFSAPGDLAKFSAPGATYIASNHGEVLLRGTTAINTMSTTDMYSPTKIEVRVEGMEGTGSLGETVFGTTNVTCHVSGCNTNNTCAVLIPGNGTSTLGAAPSTVTSMAMYYQSNTMFCELEASGTINTTSATNFVPSVVTISAGSAGAVYVKSIVIYGSQ